MDNKMNPSEVTKAKFEACINSFEWMFRMDNSDIIDFNKKINGDAFNKILVKNDMEEYSSQLYNYLEWFRLKKNWDEEHGYIQKWKDGEDLHKELTKTLVFLLSNEDGINTSITFQKSRKGLTIANKSIIECVIKGLIAEYEINNFNDDNFTDEELEEELEKDINQPWIQEWIRNDEENFEQWNNNEDGKKYKTDYFEMSMNFLESHQVKRKVNLEFLERVVRDSYSGKKKAGAKPKFGDIAKLAEQLSNLKRLDKFLTNKIGTTDIKEIPLTNADCRFIHDCLVFFGLIEDYSNNSSNTTTPEKYIRTMLKQIKMPNDPIKYRKYRVEKFCELRSKVSLITPK